MGKRRENDRGTRVFMMFFLFLTIVILISAFLAEYYKSHFAFFVTAIILVLYSGLRGPNVGFDTWAYYLSYWRILAGKPVYGLETGFVSFCEFLQLYSRDPAFLIFVTSVVTNLLIVLRLWTFRHSCSFVIMIAIYLSVYYPMSMNIMRQFFSVALIFAGTYFLEKKKPLFFIPFLMSALSIHRSSIIAIFFLLFYICRTEKKVQFHFLRFIVIGVVALYMKDIIDIIEYFLKYLKNLEINFSFMLFYKLTMSLIILYVVKFGLLRKNEQIIGQAQFSTTEYIFYIVGILLCMLGGFFKYADRIALPFLMYEMPFWGKAVRMPQFNLIYKAICIFFILFLYIMNLLTDNQHIFPYTTIWIK